MNSITDEVNCMKSSDQKLKQLPPSIRQLIESIESAKTPLTPAHASQLLRDAQVQPEDVLPWSKFGHGPRDCYGRNIVYHGGFFEIMVMSWVPGDFSSIHDHGTAQWGAVQSMGCAEHAVFCLAENKLTTKCRNTVFAGEVNGVDHDLIHQMGNLNEAPFCSLHLYGSYNHFGQITGDSRTFDLFENTVQFTTDGAFFCLPESQISGRQDGVEADYPTTMRHHLEMLKRIHRFMPFSDDVELFRKKASALESLLFSPDNQAWFGREMAVLTDHAGSIRDFDQWHIFWHEVALAADYKGRMQRMGCI